MFEALIRTELRRRGLAESLWTLIKVEKQEDAATAAATLASEVDRRVDGAVRKRDSRIRELEAQLADSGKTPSGGGFAEDRKIRTEGGSPLPGGKRGDHSVRKSVPGGGNFPAPETWGCSGGFIMSIIPVFPLTAVERTVRNSTESDERGEYPLLLRAGETFMNLNRKRPQFNRSGSCPGGPDGDSLFSVGFAIARRGRVETFEAAGTPEGVSAAKAAAEEAASKHPLNDWILIGVTGGVGYAAATESEGWNIFGAGAPAAEEALARALEEAGLTC